MVDLLSLYRDILLLQLGVGGDPINAALLPDLDAASRAGAAEATLATLDALAEARLRIGANVAPALALEAALVSATRHGTRSGGRA